MQKLRGAVADVRANIESEIYRLLGCIHGSALNTRRVSTTTSTCGEHENPLSLSWSTCETVLPILLPERLAEFDEDKNAAKPELCELIKLMLVVFLFFSTLFVFFFFICLFFAACSHGAVKREAVR